MTRIYAAALRFQFLQLRRSADELMTLIVQPLFTVAFLAILIHSGRRDLAPYAVVGAAMMSVWVMALWGAGSIIQREQWDGTFEAVAGTPAPYAVVLVGRISAVTAVSLLALAENMLLAWLGFGIVIHVPHPWAFLLTLVCTAVAVAGTGAVMSVLFVAGRSATVFQNSMTYPFYLLSGAVVPISLLPGWIQPLSKLVFLSWTAQLLRDTLLPAPVTDVPFRLGVITVAGLAAFALAFWLVGRVLRRHRALGTLGWN